MTCPLNLDALEFVRLQGKLTDHEVRLQSPATRIGVANSGLGPNTYDTFILVSLSPLGLDDLSVIVKPDGSVPALPLNIISGMSEMPYIQFCSPVDKFYVSTWARKLSDGTTADSDVMLYASKDIVTGVLGIPGDEITLTQV